MKYALLNNSTTGPLIVSFTIGIGVLAGAEVDDLPEFKVRDDDVWVCSWPRSGEFVIA